MVSNIDDFDMKEYDRDYVEGVTDKFAESVLDLLLSLVKEEDLNLNEKFTSTNSLVKHFRQHCMGTIKKKSIKTNVIYDFTTVQQYSAYEREINSKFRQSSVITIDTLYNEKDVVKAFRKLFEGNKQLLFSPLCGFRNDLGKVYIGLDAYANDVTTNYTKSNTINVIILTQGLETITLYAVDARHLESKINGIVALYHSDKSLKVQYTKSNESLKEEKNMADYEEKKQALANYLNCSVEEIEDGYDEYHFDYGNEEYMVLTDSEADEMHEEYIENFIDDVGISGFTKAFQDWIVTHAIINERWFEEAQRESAENYIDDIESENDSTYENRLIAELVENGILDEDRDFYFDEDDEDEEYPLLNDNVNLENAKEEYIDTLCEEDAYEWYVFNFGEESLRDLISNGTISLDTEAISNEIISWDGRGNNLGTYSGEEIELEDDLYAYRTN